MQQSTARSQLKCGIKLSFDVCSLCDWPFCRVSRFVFFSFSHTTKRKKYNIYRGKWVNQIKKFRPKNMLPKRHTERQLTFHFILIWPISTVMVMPLCTGTPHQTPNTHLFLPRIVSANERHTCGYIEPHTNVPALCVQVSRNDRFDFSMHEKNIYFFCCCEIRAIAVRVLHARVAPLPDRQTIQQVVNE